MVGVSSTDGHELCVVKNCHVISGLAERFASESQHQAVQVELAVTDLLSTLGFSAQRKPSLPLFDKNDRALEPDVGLNVAGTPGVLKSRGASIDTVVEIRIQSSPGSADLKNEATLSKYSECATRYGLGALMLHVLCPRAVGEKFIDNLAAFAQRERVGFLPVYGLTKQSVLDELAAVASVRSRQAQQLLPEVLADRYADSLEDLAAAVQLIEMRRRGTAPQ